jgi:hypothetical protein
MQRTTGGEGTSVTGSALDSSEADATVLGTGAGGGIVVERGWTESIFASMTIS